MQIKDEIRIHIEDDGAVTITTHGFSADVHAQADEFIKMTFEDLGGDKRIVKRLPKPHSHDETLHDHNQTPNKVKA